MLKRMLVLGIAASAVLMFWTGTSSASDPILRLPFITIEKGSLWEGLYVRFPGGTKRVSKTPPMEQQPGKPESLPQPQGAMPPPPAGPVVVQAMSHRDFACAFKPMEGTHKVWLIHPYTCCPVEVCFTLPCGCPKVKSNRHEIVFDYGKNKVEIRFYRCGDVEVKCKKGCFLFSCLR
jgi:hypothetical protein